MKKVRYKGRLSQTFIYLGKLLRMFVYQNDWKVLPMGAVIAAVVTFVVGRNLFVTQEGTLTGSFAVVCVCIWNGFFNSIQSVCRERDIVKREHRSGLHLFSYIAAHMIYQLLLCTAQTVITLVIFRMTGVPVPAQGVVTRWGIADLGITVLLVTYASDMMALAVSCIVRSTTAAMTVMPFLLMFQLVFSGSVFELAGSASKVKALTVSHWGIDSFCAVGRYNEQPMVTLWNTIFKFRNVEILGQTPLLDLIRQTEQNGSRDAFLLWSGSYNTLEEYAATASNVLHCWGCLAAVMLVSVLTALLALRAVDKDKR